MSLLLVDAPSGIAGDMFLAALVDLGFPLADLERAFHEAGMKELRLSSEEVISHGLRGLHLNVHAPADQSHRGLSDCLALVDALSLPPDAAALARRLFRRLAHTEARLHGSSIDEVHFHEVGAVDSLVDRWGPRWVSITSR